MMGKSEAYNLVCPHCIAPIDSLDHFCPSCNRPITAHASTDPIGQIISTGQAYRNAMESPRWIVVLGVWLIFAPQVPFLLVAMFGSISNLVSPGQTYRYGDGASMTPISQGAFTDIIQLLIFSAVLLVYLAIILKVTTRFYRARTLEEIRRKSFKRNKAVGFPVIPLPPDQGGERSE